MLKPLLQSSTQNPFIFLSCMPTVPGHGTLPRPTLSASVRQRRALRNGRIHCSASEEAQTVVTTSKSPVTVKAVVTVKQTLEGIFAHIGITRGLDDISDVLGKTLLLELVSAELDPKTGLEKETIHGYAHKGSQHGDDVKYEASYKAPTDFGEIGGVFVTLPRGSSSQTR